MIPKSKPLKICVWPGNCCHLYVVLCNRLLVKYYVQPSTWYSIFLGTSRVQHSSFAHRRSPLIDAWTRFLLFNPCTGGWGSSPSPRGEAMDLPPRPRGNMELLQDGKALRKHLVNLIHVLRLARTLSCCRDGH